MYKDDKTKSNTCETKNSKETKSTRNSSNRKHNRNNNNKPSKQDKRPKMGQLDDTGRDNDPNWYFLDSNVADQAATFAFDQYLGVDNAFSIAVAPGYNQPIAADTAYMTAPAIMTMKCNPSAGLTNDRVSGINIAALRTYTTLSSRNAKTTNYAPQDISALILAFGELLSIEEHIRRAFGVAFTYNQRNRALPVKLLTAMGFDADDFLSNLADHRLEFNSVITAINKIPFPTNIAYVYKCMDMYQGVYLDSESPMAQVLLARPFSTWTLNETISDKGSVLKTTPLPNENASGVLEHATFEDWILVLKAQVTALMESATLNYIYSDILMLHDKYSLPLATLDILQADYAVVPQYNRNFALQFHNSNAIGIPASEAASKYNTPDNDVLPDVNFNKLDYRPYFTVPSTGVVPFENIIDMDVPEASVVDRIEATRFTSCIIPDGWQKPALEEDKSMIVPYALPDHYVVMYGLYLGTCETNDDTTLVKHYEYINQTGFSSAVATPVPLELSQIDWHPIIYVGSSNNNASASALTVFGDLNYWTKLNYNWFKRVNDLSFQALFTLR